MDIPWWVWILGFSSSSALLGHFKNIGFGKGFGIGLFLGPIGLLFMIFCPREIAYKDLSMLEKWERNYHKQRKWKPELAGAILYILARYCETLQNKKTSYEHVSRLPFDKRVIMSAFYIAIHTSTDPEVTEHLKVGALFLSDWQDDVHLLQEIQPNAIMDSSLDLLESYAAELLRVSRAAGKEDEQMMKAFSELTHVRKNDESGAP